MQVKVGKKTILSVSRSKRGAEIRHAEKMAEIGTRGVKSVIKHGSNAVAKYAGVRAADRAAERAQREETQRRRDDQNFQLKKAYLDKWNGAINMTEGQNGASGTSQNGSTSDIVTSALFGGN